MTEEKITNEITYEDGWQNASYPEYSTAVNEAEDTAYQEKSPGKKPDKAHNSQVLITVQLIVCIFVALAALVIKTIGGDFYNSTRQWYYSELNKSIIAQSDGEDYDISEIFDTATNNEI